MILGLSRTDCMPGFWIRCQGAELLGMKGGKIGVLAVFRGFKAVSTLKRCSRTPRSMIRYPRECRGTHLRLLPTAGVCDQRVGVTPRLLPTAGVCDQHVGASLRPLPTAGVCEQRLCASLRLLPTAGVCDQHLGACPRHLLSAGAGDQSIGWFPRL